VTSTRKKLLKDAPVSSSNIGKRFFKKNWRELKKNDPNTVKKTPEQKVADKVKRIEKKKVKAEQKANNEAAQGFNKYEKEEEKNKKKKNPSEEDEEDGDIRPGDFLFHYARFNLGEQALTKPISLHVREAMWRLYDADHTFWTPARLGTKFGFSLEVTTGVIIMKAYERYLERRHERRIRQFKKVQDIERLECIKNRKLFQPKKLPRCGLLSEDLELAMGAEFGWMATEGLAPKPVGGFGLFSDIAMMGDQYDMGLLARASFKVAPPPHELPNRPPSLYEPSRIIRGPTRANKFYRAKLLIVDIEKTRKGKVKPMIDSHRFAMIRELDGTLRTPTWQERLDIQKHYLKTGGKTKFHDVRENPLSYYNTRGTQKYKGTH